MARKAVVKSKKAPAKKKTVSRPVGRPTAYRIAYNAQVYKLCLLGAIDTEIADFFEVSEDTIHEWKHVHPKFSESIKKGKQIADANVASKLYHRATGYEHPDVDIKMFEGQIIETPLVKHYPPDTTAGIFWLKNRQPKKWRDKQEIDHTSKGESIVEKADFSKLSKEEKLTLLDLHKKTKAAK